MPVRTRSPIQLTLPKDTEISGYMFVAGTYPGHLSTATFEMGGHPVTMSPTYTLAMTDETIARIKINASVRGSDVLVSDLVQSGAITVSAR